MTKRQKRRKFIRFCKNHGFGYPRLTQVAIRITGIKRAEALALLTLETGGGRNVFGCDHGPGRAFCHEKVTVRKLIALLRSGLFNGVGPNQLTFGGFIDQNPDPGDPRLLAKRMKKVGIAWAARPGLNLIKGFSIYWNGRKSGESIIEAGTRYNGAREYGVRLAANAAIWQNRLDRVGL